jgi:hypothetical protein
LAFIGRISNLWATGFLWAKPGVNVNLPENSEIRNCCKILQINELTLEFGEAVRKISKFRCPS